MRHQERQPPVDLNSNPRLESLRLPGAATRVTGDTSDFTQQGPRTEQARILAVSNQSGAPITMEVEQLDAQGRPIQDSAVTLTIPPNRTGLLVAPLRPGAADMNITLPEGFRLRQAGRATVPRPGGTGPEDTITVPRLIIERAQPQI